MSNTLTFETLAFKNFQSYGNKETVIDFRKSNNILVSGKNGHGKSTIISCITYVLYGRAYTKVKKDELINRVNDAGLEVTIVFRVNDIPYRVVRGMKPNIFEIYKNDVLIDQTATVREYQLMLEKTIIGMSELTFRQTVILGSADYIPFMRMNAKDRRIIIEELLDIQMFSVMNQLNKERMSVLKKDLSDQEHAINLTKNSIAHIKKHTQSTIGNTEQLLKENQEELNLVKQTEKELEKTISSLSKQIDEERNNRNKSEHKSRTRKLKKLKEYAVEFAKEVKRHKDVIEFYENNDNCPTCLQAISKEIKDTNVNKANNQVNKYSDAITEAKNNAIVLQKEINTLNEELQNFIKVSEELARANIKLIENKKEQQKIKDRAESIKQKTNVDNELSKLKELQKKLDEQIETRSEINKNIELHNAVNELLKDEGVKSKIISNYIPIFNSLIQKYMTLLEFDISFTVDSQFNDIIKVGRDIVPYMSNSEGQKKRLDLAMLFAMRDLAVVKNSTNTNLLILDEIVDSSLDGEGIESFMKIMKEVSSEGTTVIVISHRSEMNDKFDGEIIITKEGKFSKLVQS